MFPAISFFLFAIPPKYLLPLSAILPIEYAAAPRVGFIAPNAEAKSRAVLPI